MPSDFEAWARKGENMGKASVLRGRDEVLWRLLNNQASGELKAAALSGSLSPFAPDPAEMQKEAERAELKELIAAEPFKKGNVTQMMRVEMLSPETAARLKKEARAGVDESGDSPAMVQRKAALERARLASVKGFRGRVE